jgi:hypothetical protein
VRDYGRETGCVSSVPAGSTVCFDRFFRFVVSGLRQMMIHRKYSRRTRNPRLNMKSYNWRVRWNIDCWGSISNVIKISYIHTQYVPSTTRSALGLACGEHKLSIIIVITTPTKILYNSSIFDRKSWLSAIIKSQVTQSTNRSRVECFI